MARAARDVPNRYTMVAAGGETVITPGFSFVVGAHALQVYDNGVLLDDWAAALHAAGIEVILNTGRSAGWGAALLAYLPGVSAVIVENGGFGAQAAAPIARQVLDYYLLGKLPAGAAREDAAAIEEEEREE